MFKVADGSHGIKFRIHRLSILIFTLLLYMTVFFHRNCLNVITKQKETPLIAATKGRNTNIVKLLLDMNVDINVKDAYGKTALFIAYEKRYHDIIYQLENRKKKNRPNC